ncbi:putative prolyl 4-hydroxylase 7-like protein [Cladobotryum mycophilum]|uniref:Prolyl 4-hydroxylase 7-like protein n=1 Tax=Cladobotryum mycophilum TaxID=491253 RepID=A0ABR0SUD5_9HYPO
MLQLPVFLMPTTCKTNRISDSYVCDHQYTIEIVSFDPWVIYINNFVKEEEIQHLLEVAGDKWFESEVYSKSENDNEYISEINKEWRSSKSAYISSNDKLVRYDGGERFRLHQDWINPNGGDHRGADAASRPFDRLLSIFVYLEDNCTGGETYFPVIKGVGLSADGRKFSRAESGQGLLFKSRRGNAVVWKNLHNNGTGDSRMLHASLPVKSGRKVGMNPFSLYYLDTPMVGW